jgi:periplasmic divalent cation tolerance protein
MPAGTTAKVVLVTCGNRAEARRIAQAVVAKRLAACVNVVSAPVESIYRWKEKVVRAKEFLLVIKTTGRRLKRLKEAVLGLHSYDVPEFLVVGVAGGSREYLDWLGESVRESGC